MNRIARIALAALIALASLVISTSAASASAPTYTQRLHTMAAQVRAHGVPCATEDGSYGPLPCYWDARSMGNGRGESFVILNGGVTEDGTQRVVFVYRNRIERAGYGI